MEPSTVHLCDENMYIMQARVVNSKILLHPWDKLGIIGILLIALVMCFCDLGARG